MLLQHNPIEPVADHHYDSLVGGAACPSLPCLTWLWPLLRRLRLFAASKMKDFVTVFFFLLVILESRVDIRLRVVTIQPI